MNAEALDHAAELIAQADALIVAAGAGMGVDSGLPDFRGAQGFWRAYPALGRAGLSFTSIASPASFERDPRLAWGFYGHRLALYRRTVPHAGFALLRRWGERMQHGLAVFTSNVDGQFQRAGYDEALIHECHGSLHWLQCLRGCRQNPWPADALAPDIDEAECRWRGELPACPGCGGLARPNLLMFGDWGWLCERYDAQAGRLARWLPQVERPVVVEIGAGTDVPSVRHFGQRVLVEHGGQLLRINPREPAIAPAFGVGLACGAVEALVALDERLGVG
ncbi:SIR2 family NAD-dependent protein deacylase [Roseateles saccharophilus]|uniref:protein acetyllysine N-acetyltransferase n=1 Tax=Roseateles saccharophilus TaxID=304 RepID=A0A4R3UJS6_ROSSA|nr:Sir2 family NAD-dependent protein deacetylase [Roseateles saccharophilus]MDG0834358.1 NAD-dependent deacetylase [Roseateles saccharophilus]TCU90721.1 NAD-dependent SIR2 family protein deacetylase [Roseateles saccharophilus]